MGYAGGSSPSPSYHAIGDHSESIQIDFNPDMISYGDLLNEFLAAHDPSVHAYSRQYASLIHVHDEAQRAAAEQAIADHHARTGKAVFTQIVPLSVFTLAEDYHQKYQLRQTRAVEVEFEALYPDYRALANSTAAMRVNAYAGGYLPLDGLAAEAPSLGLSDAAAARLAADIERWYR